MNEVRRKQRWRRQSGSKVRRREDWERKRSWPLDWESGFDLRGKIIWFESELRNLYEGYEVFYSFYISFTDLFI